jgi:pentatricopeptide repeat protein
MAFSILFYLFLFPCLHAWDGVFLILLSFSWARRGDVWEAADLMQQMRKEGVQPDIHAYTSFINACCKAGDMQVCLLINVI